MNTDLKLLTFYQGAPMKPYKTYIFTSIDDGKWITIVATDVLHARQLLADHYGKDYRVYAMRCAGLTGVADDEEGVQLITKVAEYLGRSVGTASFNRAKRVIEIIRESSPPEPLPGDVSPLSQASALLGKRVIVTDHTGTPAGAGIVESVEKTYTRGMTLSIKNFGTANSVAYSYASYTFTEIETTN